MFFGNETEAFSKDVYSRDLPQEMLKKDIAAMQKLIAEHEAKKAS